MEVFTRINLDAENCEAAERYSKAEVVLPTVDTHTRRPGRGGGKWAVGGILPTRLKHGV